MMPRYTFFLAMVFSAFLTACGGGGGGSGSGGNNGGGSNTSSGGSVSGTGSGSTSITVSPASLTFNVTENLLDMDSKSASVTFNGAGVVIGYPTGMQEPGWLIIETSTYSQSPVTVNFRAHSSALPPGTYGTTLRFVTGRDDGTQIKYADIPVTLNVKPDPTLKITTPAYSGNFLFGASKVSENLAVSLTGATEWSATSDKTWLKSNNTSGTGATTLNTSVDVVGLLPGDHTATLAVVDKNNAANKVTLSYKVHISAPELSIQESSLILGGADGVSGFTKELNFSLNTDTKTYPYAITMTTDDGKAWISADKIKGNISATPEKLNFTADTTLMPAGTYTGNIKVEATVSGLKVSKEIPITFNKEANRIYAGLNGIAFSKLQNQSVLTRKIKIFNSLNRTDIPWTAESDQSWLNVTSSGKTGDYITLTASPGSLAAGQYFANVTIKSSNSEVINQDSIRVGFTVSTDVLSEFSLELPSLNNGINSSYTQMAVSPVEPVVFTNVGSSIKAYNIYTGDEIRSFSAVVASAGNMTVSGDGRSLFTFDTTNFEVVEVDSVTGVIKHKYPVNAHEYMTNQPVAIAYTRPNGVPVLISTGPKIYDLTSTKRIENISGNNLYGMSLSVGEDPSLVVNTYGVLFRLNYSAIASKGFNLSSEFSALTVQGAEGEACMNADSTRVYTASANPYSFPGTGIESRTVEQTLPGEAFPNSLQCVWNGLIIGGTSSYPDNIYIYNGKTGVNLGIKKSAPNNPYENLRLRPRGLAVSAEGTRLIALSEGYGVSQIRFMSLPVINQ